MMSLINCQIQKKETCPYAYLIFGLFCSSLSVKLNLLEGGCKFVLAFPDGAVVLAHAGLGSASEVGLATTQDQPTAARWQVSAPPFL